MPCDATCAPEVFLFDAKGVCFLATATRRLGANDTVRLYSRWYSWDACRPGETISDLLAATWACVQAASEAAPRITASHCMTLRRPEPEIKGTLMQIASMSMYEVLAQLLENISSPAYRIRHAQVAILSGRNQARRGLLRHHSRDFTSVLSLSYIWRLTSRPSAQRQHAKVNGHDRSSWPLAGNTCVAISGWRNRTLLRARAGFRPFPGTKLIGVGPTLAAMFFRLWRCRLGPCVGAERC